MKLSPAERREVLDGIIQAAARQLLDEVRASCDLEDLVLLPMSAAAPVLGLSPRQIPQHLPTVAVTPRKHAVTLSAIKRHIAANTRLPATSSRNQEAGAPAPASASTQ